MSAPEVPSSMARKAGKRALSKIPAMPITRFRGKPVMCAKYQAITSSGFVTTTTMAFGACCFTASAAGRTISALALRRSVRDIPGLRGKPAVITTTSAPFTATRSVAPVTCGALCQSGAASSMSSAFPCGMPSISGRSMSVTSASPRSAMYSAALAPTLPAPITATLFFTGFSSGGHEAPRWSLCDGSPRKTPPPVGSRPAAVECAALQLSVGLGHRPHHVHPLARAPGAGKRHFAVHEREQGVVPPEPDVRPGEDHGAALAHEDAAGAHGFAAELLDAEPLGIRIAAVLGRGLAFFVSHGSLSSPKWRSRGSA